jgi:hypothetical protein
MYELKCCGCVLKFHGAKKAERGPKENQDVRIVNTPFVSGASASALQAHVVSKEEWLDLKRSQLSIPHARKPVNPTPRSARFL